MSFPPFFCLPHSRLLLSLRLWPDASLTSGGGLSVRGVPFRLSGVISRDVLDPVSGVAGLFRRQEVAKYMDSESKRDVS